MEGWVDIMFCRDADTPEGTEMCMDCGEPVGIGSWPFCASDTNPDGHAKGTYQFGIAQGGGQMKKWTHTGSKSPK